MIQHLFCITLLAVFGNVVSARGHCNAHICILNADAILAEPFECVETPRRVIQAITPCTEGCLVEVINRMIPYGRVLQDKEENNNCRSGRALSPCNPAEIFTCALGTLTSVQLATTFRIDDLFGLCRDLGSLTRNLNLCSRCIIASIPGYEVFGEEVMKYVNISLTMVNGACNCTRDIKSQVDRLNGATDCVLVSAIANLTRLAAADCSLRLAYLPLQLPWMKMVADYIVQVVPLTASLCGLAGPAVAAASAIFGGLSFVVFVTMAASIFLQKDFYFFNHIY